MATRVMLDSPTAEPGWYMRRPLPERMLLGPSAPTRPDRAGEGNLADLGHLPETVKRLRRILHAQSRIESRIVMLQWVVMVLVGIGVVVPHSLGSGLSTVASALVLLILGLHPVAYLAAATYAYNWMIRNQAVRVAILSAIDVTVAVGVLFLTATEPGYTQVLLFSVVLLTATRYSLSRALGITSLMAVLQFFSILASARHVLQVTNLSSAIVAMFALTYGVNLLSQAERKEAAIAQENARLYRAVLLRNRELATINALSQSASQDTDPERLLESGLELILSSIPVAWGQAFRYSRRLDLLDLLFVRNAGAAHLPPADVAAALAEASQAARSRVAVIGTALQENDEVVVRVSTPVLVQGNTAAVLQTLVPRPSTSSEEELPAQSLSIVCQELGTSVEKALLRDAAQRSLVLEEKHRIARDLHDTVLQYLFSSNLGVEWCMQRSARDPQILAKLAEIRRFTAQASGELRGAIFTLSSRVAEVGLVPALETLTAGFAEQHDLQISFSAVGQPAGGLSVLTQNAVHRVVRESLMNTHKHAQASHVAVRVVFDAASITVVVHDDGVGIPDDLATRLVEESNHFGLRTLARQVQDLRGRFEIMKGEEGGTIVRAIIPARMEAEGNQRDRSYAR